MDTLRLGETVTVELAATPSTGYRWELAELPAAFVMQGSGFRPGAAEPGAGGTQYFVLRATASGTQRVTFVLKRPWETDRVGTHTAHIEVIA